MGSRSLLCVLPARERPLQDKGSPSVELVLTQSSSPVSPEDLQHRPTSHLQYLCRHGHNIKFPTGGRSSSPPPSTTATATRHRSTTSAPAPPAPLPTTTSPSSLPLTPFTPCQIKIPEKPSV